MQNSHHMTGFFTGLSNFCLPAYRWVSKIFLKQPDPVPAPTISDATPIRVGQNYECYMDPAARARPKSGDGI